MGNSIRRGANADLIRPSGGKSFIAHGRKLLNEGTTREKALRGIPSAELRPERTRLRSLLEQQVAAGKGDSPRARDLRADLQAINTVLDARADRRERDRFVSGGGGIIEG